MICLSLYKGHLNFSVAEFAQGLFREPLKSVCPSGCSFESHLLNFVVVVISDCMCNKHSRFFLHIVVATYGNSSKGKAVNLVEEICDLTG